MSYMLYVTNILYNTFVTTMDYLGRRRIIYDQFDGQPYLERYYIFFKDRQFCPFNIFLHRFLKSDPDDLHDHPWSFRTFILFGGYWEHTETGKFWRAPFSYRYAPANLFHRIELDQNVPYCWTLFIPGLKCKEWGFKTKNTWLHNNDYFALKAEEKRVATLLAKEKEAKEKEE